MDGITIVDPRFESFVLPNAPLETLADGFLWLEGPVWFTDLRCLQVSDLPNDRIMRWTESGGVSVFRAPSTFANGHVRDREGRLVGCSHGNRCIQRTELDGLRVFDICDDGARLSNARVFYKVSPGFTDGVHCISANAELLGRIDVPFTVSNLCFGGRHRSRLFICGSHTLFAIYVNRRGAQRP